MSASTQTTRLRAGSKYKALGHKLPKPLSDLLFGNRQRFGLVPDRTDSSWIEWQQRQFDFYQATQRDALGGYVNRAGYGIVSQVNLTECTILEIGPGDIEHFSFWNGRPKLWVSLDVRRNLLELAAKKLEAVGVEHKEVLMDAGDGRSLPFPDKTFDAVFTFFVLEHIHPLDTHLDEIRRVLKPGGKLVGGIPCEGGLAWGLGRYLTSRRWLLRNTNIDPDRIICWEHPNFADHVLNRLSAGFVRRSVCFWPFRIPSVDINLVASFVFEKE